jgi:hypothetical protein
MLTMLKTACKCAVNARRPVATRLAEVAPGEIGCVCTRCGLEVRG